MQSGEDAKYNRYLTLSTAPAIVQANQKDSYFINQLASKFSDVIQVFKNSRFIHLYNVELKMISTIFYLILTTLLGAKTLGEEYVDLIYVDRKGNKIPKFLPRLGFILSYTLLPYSLSKLSKFISNITNNDRSGDNSNLSSKSKLKNVFSKLTFTNIADLMNLHLALFYFSGKYYQLSKRVFGLRYALGYKPDPRSIQSNGNYELLGGLMMLQLIIKHSTKLKKIFEDNKNSENNKVMNIERTELEYKEGIIYDFPEFKEEEFGDKGKNDVDEDNEKTLVSDYHISLEDVKQLPYIPEDSRSCMLCLSPMTDPTCATCGHIFCWGCIMNWCKERKECPLCRASVKESQMLLLR